MYHRIAAAWRNISFHKKLVVLMLLVVALILGCSQPVLYYYVSGVIYDQARQEAHMTLVQAQTYMDTKLNHVVERLFYIQLDPGFSQALKTYLGTNSSAAWGTALASISPVLSLHRVTEPLISSLYLYTPKGAFSDGGLALEQGYHLEDSALYDVLAQAKSYVTWAPMQTDEIFITHRKVIPVMYQFSVEGYDQPCVLVANIDVRALTIYLQNITPSEEIQLLMLDEARQAVSVIEEPMYETLKQQPQILNTLLEAENTMQEAELSEERYLLAHTVLQGAPLRILYFQSEDTILGSLRKLRLVFLTVFILVFMLIACIVHRLVRSVTRPLLRLSQTMQQVERGENMEPFSYPYRDEVGVLTARFNAMMQHIHTLLEQQKEMICNLQEEKEKVKLEQQLKRRAELKALQAQINPHFLYNTLDSIRWKAEGIGASDISEMTKALGTLFRVGLSRGREIIALREEMCHVVSYLQIQKQRYGDMLSYTVDLPQELEEWYVVKLILQPLVENAIYHGIKERETPGQVHITGRKEGDTLLLCVEDDGPGIAPQRLEILQKDLARGLCVSGEGYGIFNVNERVRLYFGTQYGLFLESVAGEGCRATVKLPCVPQREVDAYVSLIDR